MGGASRLLLLLLATPLPPRNRSLLLLHHRLSSSSYSAAASLSLSFRQTRALSPRHKSNAQSLSPKSTSRRLSSFAADSTVSIPEDFFPEPAVGSSGAHTDLAPAWNSFLSKLSACGYFSRKEGAELGVAEDELVKGLDVSEELVRGVRACLAFARDRPYLLREVDRRDVEVVIQKGSPNLFENGEVLMRRMISFLSNEDASVTDSGAAQTVDLMKYILSSTILPDAGSCNQELVASGRKLLSQLGKLCYSAPAPTYANNVSNQYSEGYGQRPQGQNVEMKRGDWICPRCNFMNFARNFKCLECEEARPKRQLTGGEWECPQCDFFNYGKNVACLRCDCKKPGEVSTPLQSRLGVGPGAKDDVSRDEIQRKLAANDEKAQRWFSKISKLDSPSEMQKAIEDEDFPEIMPLRKGVNRFVVSTRKTPLERRLENAQLQGSRNVDDQKSSRSSVSEILDSALGNKSVGSDARGKNSAYVPFVPLPADMFAKKPENAVTPVTDKDDALFSNSSDQPSVISGSEANNESAFASPLHGQRTVANGAYDPERGEEESGRWFKKISDLHDAQDPLSSPTSNEKFPETMPMRKGENRFVVGKMRDRSLNSPLYKRRATMEQAGTSNYVPFVPFPPGYFAKKDNQGSEGGLSTTTASSETNLASASPVELPGKEVDSGSRAYEENSQRVDNTVQHSSNAHSGAANVGTQMQDISMPPTSSDGVGNAGFNGGGNKNEGRSTPNIPGQTSDGANARERWTGKSLEGSAVKEGPDPLDMSEEAKAERWFRRVAQIKDISELSQIPDEDFPSIMPMRKGVNRFVVSKRKTPLERRLTSTQYRRNLPVVRSDPIKPEDDKN